MDPVTIASAAVAALTPYFSEAGKKLAGKVGEAAFQKTGELYAWLKQRLGAKPAAQTALEDLAGAPDDPDNAASLRKELKKLLAEDADLLRELSGRLDAATQESIAFNNQIAGSVGSITQIGKAGDVHIGRP